MLCHAHWLCCVPNSFAEIRNILLAPPITLRPACRSFLQNDSSLYSLWNTLFWIAVALAAALVLHIGIRAFIIWRGWPMPLFFEVGSTAVTGWPVA